MQKMMPFDQAVDRLAEWTSAWDLDRWGFGGVAFPDFVGGRVLQAAQRRFHAIQDHVSSIYWELPLETLQQRAAAAIAAGLEWEAVREEAAALPCVFGVFLRGDGQMGFYTTLVDDKLA